MRPYSRERAFEPVFSRTAKPVLRSEGSMERTSMGGEVLRLKAKG
jgi:hypothetical protein